MVKCLGLWKRSLPTAAGLGNQRTSIVSILDSGVFCCLTLVDTESAPRPEDSRSIWPPPDRLSPAGCGHVHSGVAARHRPENAIVPWRGHGSSAIVKSRRPGRQWQTTFLLLR